MYFVPLVVFSVDVRIFPTLSPSPHPRYNIRKIALHLPRCQQRIFDGEQHCQQALTLRRLEVPGDVGEQEVQDRSARALWSR